MAGRSARVPVEGTIWDLPSFRKKSYARREEENSPLPVNGNSEALSSFQQRSYSHEEDNTPSPSHGAIGALPSFQPRSYGRRAEELDLLPSNGAVGNSASFKPKIHIHNEEEENLPPSNGNIGTLPSFQRGSYSREEGGNNPFPTNGSFGHPPGSQRRSFTRREEGSNPSPGYGAIRPSPNFQQRVYTRDEEENDQPSTNRIGNPAKFQQRSYGREEEGNEPIPGNGPVRDLAGFHQSSYTHEKEEADNPLYNNGGTRQAPRSHPLNPYAREDEGEEETEEHVLPGTGRIGQIPNLRQKSHVFRDEENVKDGNVVLEGPPHNRPWSPGRNTRQIPLTSSLNTRNIPNARYDTWEDDDDASQSLHDDETAESPYPKPLSPRRADAGNLPIRSLNLQHKPSSISFSERRGEQQNPMVKDYAAPLPDTYKRSQRYSEGRGQPPYSPNDVGNPNATEISLGLIEEHDSPSRNLHQRFELDGGPSFHSREQQYDDNANPSSSNRRWSLRPDQDYRMSRTPEVNTNYMTSIQPGPQSRSTNTKRVSYCTAKDEALAMEILSKDKDAKIEKRSSIRKFITPKAKRTTFSQRELFRAIQSVVDGHEKAGPGVVEVLLIKFVKEKGDINYIPPQNKPLTGVLKKRQEDRSGLLERAATCGDVEVVQLLSRYSDKTAKNKSLEIVLHDRNTARNRNTARDDLMISTLVLDGADVDHTINAATAAGDETLLRILLDGNPSTSALSEALPIAAATRDTLLRRRLSQILLQKGADVNSSDGESIYQAAKLFDMELLDMLLARRPRAQSLSQAFAAALDLTNSDHRFEACWKLIDAGASGQQVDKGLLVCITTEYQNIDFLRLILRSASVDYENGHALCQSITNNYPEHLKLMLANRPNGQSFDNALEVALRLRNPREQLKYCQILVTAGPPRESCSKALVVAVTSQKSELCKLFLEARASVDYNGGASITAAVRSENLGILELLIGGEFQQPSNASLIAAFDVSLLSTSPPVKKMKIIQLILDAGLEGPALDEALLSAVKRGQEGMTLCDLLLKHGASASAQGGEALNICVQSGNIVLLEKLLKSSYSLPQEALCRIFQSSLKLDRKVRARWVEVVLQAGMRIDDQVAAALDGLVHERTPDIQTIKVLLAFHTSVHYENNRPLITAAKILNMQLLTLLLEQKSDISAPSLVFETLMEDESFWKKGDAFKVLTLLIENGAEGVAVDEALIKAAGDGRPSARYFEIELLKYANVDHKDGAALQAAVKNGEPALVKRMLDMKPSSESVSMAFPYALTSKLPESTCLAVIRLFIEMAADDLHTDYPHPDIPEPPIFLCLHWYPNSPRVLEATLDAGFHIDQEVSTEHGNLTALYWALASGNKIGDHMLELLISRGANLVDHPDSLLHVAIEHGRHTTVQALLEAGADVNVTDDEDVSPLSLAIKKNDIESMKALLAANPRPNDGSLHEAARMVNADAIRLLLANGHDPNAPCSRFEGRPPLFELCYQAPTHLLTTQWTLPQKERLAKIAMEILIKAGALTGDRLSRSGHRSVLMHALDSASPVMMTRAFLQCALECGQHKFVNEDFNLFTDMEYVYSLTKYVEKGKCRGDKSQSQSLINVLKDFGAEDRYWKCEGPQPPDYINAPEHITRVEEERRETERQRKREEEEIRREIEQAERERVLAAKKLEMEERAEQARLEREDRIARMREAQAARAHAAAIAKQNDHLRIQEARGAHALKQAASMSALRNNEEEARYKRDLNLIEKQSRLVQSREALQLAFEMGQGSVGNGPGAQRRALGPSHSRSSLNLGRMLRLEPAVPSRVVEEVED